MLPDQCKGCGACCATPLPEFDVLVSVDDAVPAGLIRMDSHGLQWMRRQSGGACAGLDMATGECSIYNVRPQGCRELERGDPDCVRVLALKAAGKARPGSA